MRKRGSFLKTFLIILLIALLYFNYSDGLPLLKAKQKGYHISNSYSDGKTRYYYDGLDEKEKKAYRLIEAQAGDCPKEIPVVCLDNDELRNVYTAILYDNPELFCFGDHCTIKRTVDGCRFIPDYTMDVKEYREKKALCDKKAQEIINNAPANSSQEEKCLYIHDTILEMCEYDDSQSPSCYTIYGCLLNGKANCEGYSKTAAYLLNRMGIKTYVIVGESSSGNENPERHMWNVVEIDGKPYVMDVTWDDYRITGNEINEEQANTPSHIYFLRSASELKKTHVPDRPEDWNDCTYSDMNYYKNHGTYFDSYRSLKGKLPYRIAEVAKNGGKGIEIQLSSDSLFREAESKLFDKGDISGILSISNIGLPSSKRINTGVIKYTLSPENRVIRIYI